MEKHTMWYDKNVIEINDNYVVPEDKLFEENPPSPFQIRDYNNPPWVSMGKGGRKFKKENI